MHILNNLKQRPVVSDVARRRQIGQGMTEYIIIVALIAIAGMVGVGAFGDSVVASFTELSSTLVGAPGQDAAALAGTAIDDAANAAQTQTTLQNYNQ